MQSQRTNNSGLIPLQWAIAEPNAAVFSHVLVVEDDASVRALLRRVLSDEGFRVSEADTIKRGMETFRSLAPDLVLIDVGLPDGSGFGLLAEIRRTATVPVIMLTGRGEEIDRVLGLDLGADDYMVKPVMPLELAARIRAIARRGQTVEPTFGGSLQFGSVKIDPVAHEASVDERILDLTRREFDLLLFLAQSPRQAFSRDQLLDAVWGSRSEYQSESTVTEHVRRVRTKLVDFGGPELISTVRGVGYRLDP